jgi:hypothetical protein
MSLNFRSAGLWLAVPALLLGALCGCAEKPARPKKKKPRPRREKKEALPQTVTLCVDFEDFDGELDWNDIVASAMEACALAPMKTAEPRPPDEGPTVRFLLRWNAPRGSCRYSVGRVLCGYDRQGLARARGKLSEALESGSNSVEIDAQNDVRMRAVLEALKLVRKEGFTNVYFQSGQPVELHGAFTDIRPFYRADSEGIWCPDVTANIVTRPGTLWGNVRDMLSILAQIGVYKTHIGTSQDNLLKAWMPVGRKLEDGG